MKGLDKFCKIIGQNETVTISKLGSDGGTINVSFKIKDGATVDQILNIERNIGLSLPYSFKKFLRKFNGARIYDYDGIDGFLIYGTEDIEKINKFAKATFEEDWLDQLLVFAKYIGESNYLAFDTSNSNNYVIDCFFEELPIEWVSIEPDFDIFLSHLIDENGNKYWLYNE